MWYASVLEQSTLSFLGPGNTLNVFFELQKYYFFT